MRTKEFLITAEPFNTDILSGMLWNLDITGINEEVNCLKVFSNSVTKKEIEYLLNDMIVNKMLISFNIEENYIEEKNWNAEWENSREIIKATDRIIIKPTFKDYTPKENEIVITLDPKMSFGTGDHQTTKLILKLLEKYVLKGMEVLDVGTGTGILAIASVKLGAKKVIAHDIDNWCYENGLENSELNSTIDSIEFRICKINEIKENNFDIIVANIQKNVLIEIATDINKRMNTGGILLLSGLLHIDEEDIIKTYTANGFKKLETVHMDEWIAIAFIFSSEKL